MSNQISNELKSELFAQESGDPFLTLVTLRHADFTFYLVNNTKDILSRGQVFSATPMKIQLPADDGETVRSFQIVLDNISLELITQLRAVTGDIEVEIEFILASMPDVIQMEHTDLFIRSITYNSKTIQAQIVLDNFLQIAMTSEKYTPSNFPGLFL